MTRCARIEGFDEKARRDLTVGTSPSTLNP